MAAEHVEKTCNDCKCRDCSPITAMAERLDAYKAATSLLKDLNLPEGENFTPHEVLLLANWLYFGAETEN